MRWSTSSPYELAAFLSPFPVIAFLGEEEVSLPLYGAETEPKSENEPISSIRGYDIRFFHANSHFTAYFGGATMPLPGGYR